MPDRAQKREKLAEDYNRNPYKVAEERGLMIVLPPDDVITLDIDDGEWEHRARMPMMVELLLIRPDSIETTSASGKGLHVYIRTFRTLSALEKICVQSLLGSDYRREALCLMRELEKKTEFPNLLMFETEEQFLKVSEWLAATDKEMVF